MNELFQNIVSGAIAGGVAACSGWWKTNKNTEIEEIDIWNAIRTIAIGVGAGAVAAGLGVTIEDINDTIWLTGVTMLVDNGIKIVRRKIFGRINSLPDVLKELE